MVIHWGQTIVPLDCSDDGGHDRPWPQNNLFSHSPIPRDLHCAAYRQWVRRFIHVWKASNLCERLDRQWVPLKYLKYLLNGLISHLNGFEILILFYILYDRISEVSDWNKVFHWISQEFKIVNDVMPTVIWDCFGGNNSNHCCCVFTAW